MSLLRVPIEVPAQRFDRKCEVCGRDHECDAEDLVTSCEREILADCETIPAPAVAAASPPPTPTTESERSTYKITWSHGTTTGPYDTLEEAEAAVREVLSEAEIGHDGDIADGGERTLFWSSDTTW